MRKKLRQRGYTFVEVLSSIAVMSIGATGLIAAQKASLVGNLEARQMTVAASVARIWIERVRRDSLLWTQGGATASAANLTGTRYLSNTPSGGGVSAWITPVPPTSASSGESYAFDHFGTDTLNGTGNTSTATYCVNTRYQWVFPGQAIRVDVRVWWYRTASGSTVKAKRDVYTNCGIGSESLIADDRKLRTINTSTIVRWNPVLGI
jgi:type IV pilus assembly protein PilV